MTDFVIKAKRTIKKVAALAGSAIIASSMVAPAMAGTLADLPSPFISSAGLFDANVIVGSQTWNALVAGDPAGVASDLAGAIDVAAAFAQQALAASGASGTVSLKKPTTPGKLMNSSANYLPVGGSVDASSPTINTFNNSLTGFEWLVNETRTYNSSDYPLWEEIIVNDGNIDSTGLFRSYGGIIYNITTNGSAVPVNFDEWPMFGENYQIISAGATQIRFGQISTEEEVAFGEEVSVGDKATVVVSDWDTASSKAKVTITDADGHIWIDDYYNEGKVFDNTTNGYTVTLKDVVISTILGNSVDITWSASSLTLKKASNVNNASTLLGESSPFANWTVNFDVRTQGLYHISFTSPVLQENGQVSLSPGEMMSGSYFNISFDGWNTNNYTTISFSELDGGQGSDLVYTNNASSTVTKSLNLDPTSGTWTSPGGVSGALNSNKSNTERLLTGEDNFRFQFRNASNCDNRTNGNYTENAIAVWSGASNIWNLTAHVTSICEEATPGGLGSVDMGFKPWGWAEFNTSGGWYNISFDNTTYNISLLNWTSESSKSYTGDSELAGEFFGSGLAWAVTDVHEFNSNDTYSGTLTLTEQDSAGKTVTITVKQGEIDKVNAPGTAGTVTSGTTEYTNFGTEIDYSASEVSLSYPESRRTADLWVGRSTTETTAFSVGDTVTGTEYEVVSVGAGGSPDVNEITPGIGTVDTSVTFSSLAKPAILVGGASVNQGVYNLAEEGTGIPAANLTMDTAYIQLVENAFGGSQTVLVIAGYAAKDTKLACQLLAADIAGLSTVSLTGDTVWLDTSGSTYSEVTLI